MQRAASREGPVRDLIMLITGVAQDLADQIVLTAAPLVGQFPIASVTDHSFQRAPLFDRQLIRRHMLRAPSGNLPHRGLQYGISQTRDTENDIHADVVESGLAKLPERRTRAIRGVAAVHPAEHAVVERLNPHAHPVHPQRTQAGRVFRGNVVGIHLHSPFPVAPPSAGVGDARQIRQRQHRRGAASEIKRINGRGVLYFSAPRKSLAAHFVHPALRGARPFRIEPAVRAKAAAERYVDVNHLS